MKASTTLLCAVALVLGACDGGDAEDTDPGTPSGTDCAGSLSADIDGTAWDAVLDVCAVNDNGVFNVTGSDNDGNQLAITVMNADVGTFDIDGMQNTGRWNEVTTTFMVMFGVPGTVTIDTFDAAGASGTFSFAATDAMTSDTRDVSNGVFDVGF